METTFCFGMMKSFLTTKHLFSVEFNYKSSDVIIPKAMALDDVFTYQTIVPITSILENSYKKTKYNYYVMIPPFFSIKKKKNSKS